MPKVSVIIPTFNRANVLRRAVSSVLDQSFKDLECIVVDDGSTDETQKLISEFKEKDTRFKCVKLVDNKGVSYARNQGVHYSCESSEWIALLDSDDEWLVDRLKLQIEFAKKNPDINLIHGQEIWIRNGKKVNQKNIHKKEGGFIFERACQLCLISPSATIMKKELYHKLNGFREDYPVCEDYEMWLRITYQMAVGFIETPIIKKYGGHDDQLSSKYRAMDYWRVKAMDELAQKGVLSQKQFSALKLVLVKKCEILINGYLKHQNYQNLDFVRSVMNRYLDLAHN